MLSAQSLQKIDAELAKYPADQRRSAVMAALRIAQVEKGYLAPETIEFVADYIGIAPAAAYEVATFYNMYDSHPVGKYKLTVCTNLPCQLRGGGQAMEHLQGKLGIAMGDTTSDGLFTLQECECLGACGDAPVMLVNDRDMCSYMDNGKLDTLIDGLRTAEGQA